MGSNAMTHEQSRIIPRVVHFYGQQRQSLNLFITELLTHMLFNSSLIFVTPASKLVEYDLGVIGPI